MKRKDKNIIGILGVTMLFALFTLMHQYDWLIPPSPVAPVASSSAVPFPDAVEEHGGEDDITHDICKSFYIPKSLKKIGNYMIFEDLYIPQISSPPPDYFI